MFLPGWWKTKGTPKKQKRTKGGLILGKFRGTPSEMGTAAHGFRGRAFVTVPEPGTGPRAEAQGATQTAKVSTCGSSPSVLTGQESALDELIFYTGSGKLPRT